MNKCKDCNFRSYGNLCMNQENANFQQKVELNDSCNNFEIMLGIEIKNDIKPNYYRRMIKKVSIDALDIIQAFNLNFALGNALKYILRAGNKPGQLREVDLRKAKEYIERELNDLEKRSIDESNHQ